MKLSLLKSLAASLVVFGGLAVAKAQVLTFDSFADQTAITNGYGGLNWNNFYALNGDTYTLSGYTNGVVSHSNIALNWFANPASITSGSLFDLNSLYLTAAWNDGLHVQIDGYRAGSLIYSNNFIVNATAPTFELLNYLSVDEVRFSSAGGTPHGYVGGGTHFAMDNVTINAASAVPEPSTYGLFAAAGLIGVVALRRRIKR